MTRLAAVLDDMATRIFGWTAAEAREAGKCVRCRHFVSPETWPPRDEREYRITGICPECWANLFPDEEDEA